MKALMISGNLRENFPVPQIKHSLLSYVLSWNENSEESKLMLDAIFAKQDLSLNEKIYYMSFQVTPLAAAFYNKNFSAIESILTHDNFNLKARIHSDLLREDIKMDAIEFLGFALSSQKTKAKLEAKDSFCAKLSCLLDAIEQTNPKHCEGRECPEEGDVMDEDESSKGIESSSEGEEMDYETSYQDDSVGANEQESWEAGLILLGQNNVALHNGDSDIF